MAKLKVFVAALVFCGVLVLGTGLIAQQNAGGGVDQAKGIDPTVKALIEARIEAAKGAYEETMALSRNNGPLDDMATWSRRWMDEKIGLEPEDPKKRLAAIQEHLDRTKALEAMAVQRHEAGRGTHADTLKMRYFRLEAEQMRTELRIINPGLFPPKPAAKP